MEVKKVVEAHRHKTIIRTGYPLQFAQLQEFTNTDDAMMISGKQ